MILHVVSWSIISLEAEMTKGLDIPARVTSIIYDTKKRIKRSSRCSIYIIIMFPSNSEGVVSRPANYDHTKPSVGSAHRGKPKAIEWEPQRQRG